MDFHAPAFWYQSLLQANIPFFGTYTGTVRTFLSRIVNF
jgi:hypothetical protein